VRKCFYLFTVSSHFYMKIRKLMHSRGK
jgi:hypothetical protein